MPHGSWVGAGRDRVGWLEHPKAAGHMGGVHWKSERSWRRHFTRVKGLKNWAGYLLMLRPGQWKKNPMWHKMSCGCNPGVSLRTAEASSLTDSIYFWGLKRKKKRSKQLPLSGVRWIYLSILEMETTCPQFPSNRHNTNCSLTGIKRVKSIIQISFSPKHIYPHQWIELTTIQYRLFFYSTVQAKLMWKQNSFCGV